MKMLLSAFAAIALIFSVNTANADDHGMKKDIVDTTVAAGSFKTLVTAVKAASLVDTLKGKGTFTVFGAAHELAA